MSRYLDPKADVVFKKIFQEHPDLLKSFLNAVLPLPADGLISTLECLPSEQIPVIPVLKQGGMSLNQYTGLSVEEIEKPLS